MGRRGELFLENVGSICGSRMAKDEEDDEDTRGDGGEDIGSMAGWTVR